MSWTVLLALCAVSYALKAVGPVLAGGRELGPRARLAARPRRGAAPRGPDPRPDARRRATARARRPHAGAGRRRLPGRGGARRSSSSCSPRPGRPRCCASLPDRGRRDGTRRAGRARFCTVQRPVAIIGAPLDLGQERRGVDMGPSAIRYAGLEERLARIGLDVLDRGNVWTPEPEALALVDERARFLPEILAACTELAGARRGGRARRRAAARPRRRPLDRDRDARRPRRGRRPARRRHLDRRARRSQHARDEPVRERARDAARRGRSAARRSGSPTRGSTLPAVEPARVVLVGIRSLDPSERAFLHEHGHPRLHDERHRPDRDRARDAGGARPRRGARVRPRLARPRRARSRGRAGRRDARAAAASPTAKPTSPAS